MQRISLQSSFIFSFNSNVKLLSLSPVIIYLTMQQPLLFSVLSPVFFLAGCTKLRALSLGHARVTFLFSERCSLYVTL